MASPTSGWWVVVADRYRGLYANVTLVGLPFSLCPFRWLSKTICLVLTLFQIHLEPSARHSENLPGVQLHTRLFGEDLEHAQITPVFVVIWQCP